jgi:hypothetical protein
MFNDGNAKNFATVKDLDFVALLFKDQKQLQRPIHQFVANLMENKKWWYSVLFDSYFS